MVDSILDKLEIFNDPKFLFDDPKKSGKSDSFSTIFVVTVLKAFRRGL